MSRTCLIASIGLGNYTPVKYCFEKQAVETAFAPVAVARILGLEGARAIVLATPRARCASAPDGRNACAEMVDELRQAGLAPELQEIPEARSEQEVMAIFKALTDAIPQSSEVVLDVTFAFRHLPFVYLAALAYLVGLRGVRLRGIYYGAFEMKDAAGNAPLVEVTSLFGLLQWYHGLATLDETGLFTSVAERLRADNGRLFRQQAGERDVSDAAGAASRLSEDLAAGLPLEAGLSAARALESIAALEPGPSGAPAARLALEALSDQLRPWAIMPRAPCKADLLLTEEELRRQLGLAEWYAAHADYPASYSILREWLVNLVLLSAGKPAVWLDYDRGRKPTEDYLNAVVERCKARVGDGTEARLASAWSAISTKRNLAQHAGMTPEVIHFSADKVRQHLDECKGLLKDGIGRPALPRSGPRLLLSGLGLAPGVIYSAVLRVPAEELLVVTSAKGRERLEEALQRADKSVLPCRVIEMADPHQGFLELERHLDDSLLRCLAAAGEVVANLTGGTTAMQYVVERLADRARRLGVPVRRVALIDRRPPEQQRADPYVLAELIELDQPLEACDDSAP